MDFTTRRTLRAPTPVLGLALAALAVALASGCAKTSPAGSRAGVRRTETLPITFDVYLRVDAFLVPANTFNNAEPVLMWGYANCGADASFTACSAPTAPGPELAVQEGTTPLTVHLLNNLTATSPAGAYVEPVSFWIPGQPSATGGGAPVFIDAATGVVTSTGARAPGDYASRVRSFTTETDADGASVTTYTFANLKAGTYLYQSGTHPQVQVQMGLYGALRVYPAATTAQAYADPTSAFLNEVTLLYSEIDPALHHAVECNDYGAGAVPVTPAVNSRCPSPPPPPTTSTVHYRPAYFLVNGQSYSPGRPPLPAGPAGSPLLLRFLNAGLQNRVPQVLGPYLSVIAEDGNFISVTDAAGLSVPAPRQQYSVLLPPGKTMDAILTPAAVGDIPVFDRRLALSNGGTRQNGVGQPAQANAGMLTYLSSTVTVGAAPAPLLTATPTAVSFGQVLVDTTATRTVTVHDGGLAARTITAYEIVDGGSSPSAASFGMTTPLPVTVAGGGSSPLTVTFTPTTTGLKTAILRLSTNDPNTPAISVALQGRGI